MRVLVAGGAGFLGSHLVDYLAASGDQVVVVDDLLTGRWSNLDGVPRDRLELVQEDAANAPHGRYDRVYHLASPASPEACARSKVASLMANSNGTKHLLDIAERSGARFLFVSTADVYGEPSMHPQRESYWGHVDPVGPRSMHDEAKRFGEALTVAFVRERATDARIVRLFNTYGSRMHPDDGRMPASFISAAIQGRPLRIEGDGLQTRTLCHVSDAVVGLVTAMERGGVGEVYNIGSAEEISVRAFAELVIELAESRSELIAATERPQETTRRRPDTAKAQRELGWHLRTNLRDGLRCTIDWYRQSLPARGEVHAHAAAHTIRTFHSASRGRAALRRPAFERLLVTPDP